MYHLVTFFRILAIALFFFCSSAAIGQASADSAPQSALPANTPDASNPPARSPSEEQISLFESYVRDTIAPGPEDAVLRQFGYDLFRSSSPFAPSTAMPVGPDYQLGPGDELRISVWGKLNADHTILIDRDGKVIVPTLGVFHIAGLTFAEARSFIEKEFARYYMASEVKINISVGALRSMRVFVVGKASKPGSYVVSSMSTLINALFAADGPAKSGSLRDIQVKRNGKTVVNFDLYDFLLKGDKTKDIRLQPEDVVFIPPVGPLVAVAGFLKTPDIYELKDETAVQDVIAMAGGVNDIAFKGRLRIYRVVGNNYNNIFETNLDSGMPSIMKVRPGDIISVFPIIPEKKVVRLSGAVQREGEFGVGDGLTVKEMLALSGGLKPFAYKNEAELTRVTPTSKGPETVKLRINLEKAISGDPEHNIMLKGDDYILVRAVPEWDLYKNVKIAGQVRFPGSYTIVKGETISSIIERAGGITDKAYLKGAVFTRLAVREAQQKQLEEAIDRLEHEVISESAQDLQSASSADEVKQMQIATMTQKKAFITKLRSAKAQGRLSINFEPFDRFKGSPNDIVLNEGDEITIPETPAQVQVIGSVYNQTAFVYKSGSTVYDYIRKAGGMTKNADEESIYVLKLNGTAIGTRESSSWSLRWDSENGGWVSGFMATQLDPGDTIVIPEDTEKIYWMKDIRDITQILYQIAVTAGVLIVAF